MRPKKLLVDFREIREMGRLWTTQVFVEDLKVRVRIRIRLGLIDVNTYL